MKLVIALDGMCGDGTFTSSQKWQHKFQEKISLCKPDYQLMHEPFFYLPWQRQKIHEYGQLVLNKYDHSGNEIILFGHSIGGLIARNIAGKFSRARVTLVVTYCSPISLDFVWKLRDDNSLPQIHFIDLFDPITIFPFALNLRRPKRNHVCRPTLHFLFLHPSEKMVRKIFSSSS